MVERPMCCPAHGEVVIVHPPADAGMLLQCECGAALVDVDAVSPSAPRKVITETLPRQSFKLVL